MAARQHAVQVLLIVVVALVGASAQVDPPFDHQTQPYTSHFHPVQQVRSVAITPFFSPDHSVQTITELIESVEYGGTIDVGTPGFSSWSGCTNFTGCVGCTISNMRKEQFPVFPALLNAMHEKKATVRILTNNYNTATCSGMIAPLDFLALNGAQIKYYDTTTFWHAKYLCIDGRNVSISSINFSYTSFMKNREAGMLLGDGAEPFIAFTQAVFDADWAQATNYVVGQTYSASQKREITDPSRIDFEIPKPRYIAGAYVTPYPERVYGFANVTLYASPDYSRDMLLSDLGSATTSFQLMMYQVTDMGLCQALQDLHARGVDVTVLVSAVIYDPKASAQSAQCYQQLTNAGLTVYTTPTYYTYSHQKFWVVDNRVLGMCTGNWSPTDFPNQSYFPPYGQSGWANANRDYTVRVVNVDVVSQFTKVIKEDKERGGVWKPSSSDM